MHVKLSFNDLRNTINLIETSTLSNGVKPQSNIEYILNKERKEILKPEWLQNTINIIKRKILRSMDYQKLNYEY